MKLRRTSLQRLLLLVSTLAMCAEAWGDPQTGRRGPVLEVVVKTVEPEVLRGRLRSLTLNEGAVLLVGGEERRIHAADLVRITTTVTKERAPFEAVRFQLAGEDEFHGRVVGADGDHVFVETHDLGRVGLPLEIIQRLDTRHALSAQHRDALAWLDRYDSKMDEDRILLSNGDVLLGYIVSLDAVGVRIEGDVGETTVPFDLVVAVRFAQIASVRLPPRYMKAVLRDGARISALSLNWSNDQVTLRTAFGQTLSFPADRIVRLDMVGGRWEWLSALEPISYAHTPMLALDWPYLIDRNVLGGSITVAGESFEHGLGVHARCSLTYDLKGEYTEFVTKFGIDDDSGPLADVDVEILVDGQRRYRKQNVRRGRLEGPVRIDVTRANRIELLTDFGDNGDIQDRFNWVEAALIR